MLVAIRAGESPPRVLISAYSLAEEDTALYFQCFGFGESGETHCCDAIERAALKLELNPFEVSCPSFLTKLPTKPKATPEDPLLPSHAGMYSANKTIFGEWLFPPSINYSKNAGDDTLSFLWDDDTHHLLNLENLSPEEISTFGLFQSSSGNDQSLSFAACVKSSISGSGMHQDLNHQIDITLPPSTQDMFDISLDLLVHLPADLFINIEDAVVTDAEKTQTSLSTVYPIDQEEPTFVSPPHAFTIHVRTLASRPSVSLNLTTKLHFRYPPPQVDGNFWRIVLPAPVVVAGVAASAETTLSLAPLCPASTPLILWAAVGHSGDHPRMLIATQMVALVGATIMMRDIARVTTWP